MKSKALHSIFVHVERYGYLIRVVLVYERDLFSFARCGECPCSQAEKLSLDFICIVFRGSFGVVLFLHEQKRTSQ